MKKAPTLGNEATRIKSLLELDVLDTRSERLYDELALLASQICETPIALVSLIDSDRQWFKARIGLDVAQTGRDISFCGHAIYQPDIFEVPDAYADERFHDNPLVTGAPLIRFYAGAPLILPDGSGLGTLCVIDHHPRKLSEKQRTALSALSRQVVFHISARRTHENLRNREAQLQEALESIQQSSLQNSALLANMSEGLVFQDQSGKIISHNPASLKILGLTSDQLMGHSPMDPNYKAIREDGTDSPGAEHPSMLTLASGQAFRSVLIGITLPGDIVKWISTNSTPVFSKAGDQKPSSVISTFSDVTAEREKNLKLLQSAKMSSLGAMAGGIAHEINTPLAAIRTSAEVLMGRVDKGLADPASVKKSMSKIIEIVDRIAKIVHAMRVISRDTRNDESSLTSLRQVIDDAVSLCQERLTTNLVEVAVNCEDIHFEGRSGEICQVILNLVSNSVDSISMESTESRPPRWIRIEGLKKAQKLILSVTDSGPGISSLTASRMMEPFFTTKPVGKGTGLGLSISKTIAEDHGGSLYREAESPAMKMVLELPLQQQKVTAA